MARTKANPKLSAAAQTAKWLPSTAPSDRTGPAGGSAATSTVSEFDGELAGLFLLWKNDKKANFCDAFCLPTVSFSHDVLESEHVRYATGEGSKSWDVL